MSLRHSPLSQQSHSHLSLQLSIIQKDVCYISHMKQWFRNSEESVINFPLGLNRDGLTGEVSVLQTLALNSTYTCSATIYIYTYDSQNSVLRQTPEFQTHTQIAFWVSFRLLKLIISKSINIPPFSTPNLNLLISCLPSRWKTQPPIAWDRNFP